METYLRECLDRVNADNARLRAEVETLRGLVKRCQPWIQEAKGCAHRYPHDHQDEEIDTYTEGNARLLAAAYTSYDKHCGARAVECAEADLLGALLSALEAVEASLRYYDPRDKGQKINKAPSLMRLRDTARAALALARGEQPDTRGEGE